MRVLIGVLVLVAVAVFTFIPNTSRVKVTYENEEWRHVTLDGVEEYQWSSTRNAKSLNADAQPNQCVERYDLQKLDEEDPRAPYVNDVDGLDNVPSIETIAPLGTLKNCHVVRPENQSVGRFEFQIYMRPLTCRWVFQLSFFHYLPGINRFKHVFSIMDNYTTTTPQTLDSEVNGIRTDGVVTTEKLIWGTRINADWPAKVLPIDRVEVAHLNSAVLDPKCLVKGPYKMLAFPQLFYYPPHEEIKYAARNVVYESSKTTIYMQCPFYPLLHVVDFKFNTSTWQYFQIIVSTKHKIHVYVNGELIGKYSKPLCEQMERFLIALDSGVQYYFGVEHPKLVTYNLFPDQQLARRNMKHVPNTSV